MPARAEKQEQKIMMIRRRAPLGRPGSSAPRWLLAPLVALALAGCTATPAEFAASLSPQDPKWQTPECLEMRAAAPDFEAGKRPPMGWGTGVLLGPYGLAIAAASKEHQAKQRKLFARDMHLACSSRPLPRELVVEAELPPPPGQVVR
jgi:hypothetical protein